MAEFCTKCGKPLVEGVACDCETVDQGVQVEQAVEQPVKQADPSAASIYLKTLYELFKKIVRFPSTEGTKYVISEDRNTAFGLMGAQAIFSALFAILVSLKVDDMLGVLNSFGMGGDIKINYFKIFIVTIFASCILSGALAGILFGISYLFKNKISFNSALCVTAVRSIIIIPVTIAACVILFLNIGYGFALFFAGSIAGICYMLVVFPSTSLENKNKVPLIIFISFLVFGIVSYFVMTKCLPFYAPDSIREAFSNPSGFMHDMLGGLY